MDARERAREMYKHCAEQGKASDFFESLYVSADDNPQVIPWAACAPNLHLVRWLDERKQGGNGRTALVVGCGLGDDAEEVSRRGFAVTAFDISPTAVNWCRNRFHGSGVSYIAADLFNLPPDWSNHFNFIFEAFTLQTMEQAAMRKRAASILAQLIAPAGELLLVCRARDEVDPPGDLPYPLTLSDLSAFVDAGMKLQYARDFMDDNDDPPVRRFVVHFVR